MAVTVGELLVKIGADTAELRTGFKKAEESLKGFEKTAKSLGAILGGGYLAAQAKTMGDALYQAASQAEAEMARVEATVDAAGESWDVLGGKIDSYSQSVIRLAFDDEATATSVAKLLNVTHDYNEALRLNQTAMDLARYKGMDLESSTTAVARAYAGNTKMLKEFGIEVDAGASRMEILGAITDKVRGQSEAFANTRKGEVEALNVKWANLQETIGDRLLPTMGALATSAGTVLDGFASLSPQTQGVVTGFATLTIGAGVLTPAIYALTAAAGALGLSLGTLMLGLGSIAALGVLAAAISEVTYAKTHAAEVALKQAEAEGSELDRTKGLLDQYNELASKTKLTADEKQRLFEVSSDLAEKFPDLVMEINTEKGAVLDLKKAYEQLNEEVKQNLINQKAALYGRLDNLTQQQSDLSAAVTFGNKFVTALQQELAKKKPDWGRIGTAWQMVPDDVKRLLPPGTGTGVGAMIFNKDALHIKGIGDLLNPILAELAPRLQTVNGQMQGLRTRIIALDSELNGLNQNDNNGKQSGDSESAYDKAMAYYNHMVAVNQMSLGEQVAYLERLRKNQEDGSKEQWAIDEKLYKLKKDLRQTEEEEVLAAAQADMHFQALARQDQLAAIAQFGRAEAQATQDALDTVADIEFQNAERREKATKENTKRQVQLVRDGKMQEAMDTQDALDAVSDIEFQNELKREAWRRQNSLTARQQISADAKKAAEQEVKDQQEADLAIAQSDMKRVGWLRQNTQEAISLIGREAAAQADALTRTRLEYEAGKATKEQYIAVLRNEVAALEALVAPTNDQLALLARLKGELSSVTDEAMSLTDQLKSSVAQSIASIVTGAAAGRNGFEVILGGMQQVLSQKLAEMLLESEAFKAAMDAIMGNPIGAVLAGIGLLIGLSGSNKKDAAEAERKAEEERRKWEDSVSRISDTLKSAFSANTYGEYLKTFGERLKQTVVDQLSEAFMQSAAMKPMMERLTSMIQSATADGILTAGETDAIRLLYQQISQMGGDFWKQIRGINFALPSSGYGGGVVNAAPAGGVVQQVTVQLQIQQPTYDEAVKFAKQLRPMLADLAASAV